MKSQKSKLSEKQARMEAGEDLPEDFQPLDQGTKIVNVELPVWAIKALDRESTRRGVARQALIKMWLVDRLDDLEKNGAA